MTHSSGSRKDANNNSLVSLGTALDKDIDTITTHPVGTTFTNRTASAAILTGRGKLVGMYVNSTNAGTIRFYDNTAASGTVITNVITPVIGYHNLGNTAVTNGIYATIANTLDVTIFYEAI
jgi:hypothetical protein